MNDKPQVNWQRVRERAAVLFSLIAVVTAALYRFVPPINPVEAMAYLALAVAWLAAWLALRLEARIEKAEKRVRR